MTDLDQRQEPRSTAAGRRTRVVGLLAAPDTPAEVAAKLVDTLPDVLAAHVDGRSTWDVRTMTHPVTASPAPRRGPCNRSTSSRPQKVSTRGATSPPRGAVGLVCSPAWCAPTNPGASCWACAPHWPPCWAPAPT